MFAIRQVEKDAIVIGLISEFIKPTGKKIEDIIPNFSRSDFKSWTNNIPFMKDEKSAETALIKLAIDCYKRISKKLK